MNDSHTEEAAPSTNSAAVSPPTPPDPLATLRDRIAHWQAALAVLEVAQAKLTPEIMDKVRLFGDQVDFDCLTRPEVTTVLLALGGKWTKELNYDNKSLDYTTSIDGIKFRLWAAAPPPSCRIVEETTVVPEHVEPERVVPETVVTTKRLICTEDSND